MAHLIKQDQDKHLKFVLDQPEEGLYLKNKYFFSINNGSLSVLIEFCKLAIEYINNGVNEKKCSVAASKLKRRFLLL